MSPEAEPSDADSGPESAAQGSSGRTGRALVDWLVTVWLLVAGGFLLVAPRSPLIWTDRFFAWCQPLRALMWTDGARWAVSILGGLLIAAGSWDIAKAAVGRRT